MPYLRSMVSSISNYPEYLYYSGTGDADEVIYEYTGE